MPRRLRKPKPLTKRQMDRALLKLFNVEGQVIPRCAMPINLFNYVCDLYHWEKQK